MALESVRCWIAFRKPSRYTAVIAGPGVWAWAVPFDTLGDALHHLDHQLRHVCASRTVAIEAGGQQSLDVDAAMTALRRAPDGSCWPELRPIRRSNARRRHGALAAGPAR